MALTSEQITALNFKDFYNVIRPYLNGTTHMGFTPVGTIISVMGTTPPQNYLTCDGTIYNIGDYPNLANYFTEQFGANNHFGGDGTTTFAVPDLRGEFLRGAGTNSHAKQGAGGNVGEHQDGTEHQNYNMSPSGIQFNLTNNTETNVNKDSELNRNYVKWVDSGSSSASTPNQGRFTSRPTNTSVLYCIATHNIFIDERLDFTAEEKIVGAWIDSKPLYQRTITFTSPTGSTASNVYTLDNEANVVNYYGYILSSTGTVYQLNTYISDGAYINTAITSDYHISQTTSRASEQGRPVVCTIQYTKTSD